MNVRNTAKYMFLVGVRKKHLHCTISRRPRTAFSKQLESRCLHIPVNLCWRIFVHRHRNFLSGGGWIISFRQLAVWDSQNVLKFSFWLKFLEIQLFFWHFDTSIALKRLNFPNNLNFKGKTVAKFLLRSLFLPVYNNMTIKQQITRGAIQKVWRLHNFHPIKLSHFVKFTLSTPLCYPLKIKLWNERKENVLYIWLLQRIKYTKGGSK